MKKLSVALITLLVSVSTAFAGNVETFGIGSRATALGGAYTATADDPFAAYYNPAGLSQIDKHYVAAGVHIVDPSLKIKGYKVYSRMTDGNVFGPVDVSDSSDTLLVPHLGYAQPINDKISIGVAAYVPFGLDITWPRGPVDSPIPTAYNFFGSYYIREVVTPTISYKVNDKFSIGFGVSLGKSTSGAERINYYPTSAPTAMTGALMKAGYDQATAGAMAQGAFATLPGGRLPASQADAGVAFAGMSAAQYQGLCLVQAAHDINNVHTKIELTDDFNYSFNVGMLYKPIDFMTLGLTYRSQAQAEFEGDAYFNGVHGADVEMQYDHPEQVQLGVRIQPHKRFFIEGDVVWTQWGNADYQKESFEPALLGMVPYKQYERDWRNTNQVRLGAEWQATDIITLRGGYFYDPSPIPDKTFDLMWPDADRKTYSLGAGFNFGNLTVDLAVQYAIAEDDRFIGGESENLNSSYNPLKKSGIDNQNRGVSGIADGYLWAYGMTVSYQF